MMRSTKFIAIVATLLVGANAEKLCRFCQRSEEGKATVQQHRYYVAMQRAGLSEATGKQSMSNTNWSEVACIVLEKRRQYWKEIENCPVLNRYCSTCNKKLGYNADTDDYVECCTGVRMGVQQERKAEMIRQKNAAFEKEQMNRPQTSVGLVNVSERSKQILDTAVLTMSHKIKVSTPKTSKPKVPVSNKDSKKLQTEPRPLALKRLSLVRACRLCRKLGKQTREAHLDELHIKRTCPPGEFKGFSNVTPAVMKWLRNQWVELETCPNIDPICYNLEKKNAIERAERALREQQMKKQKVEYTTCTKCDGKGIIKKSFFRKEKCNKCGGSGRTVKITEQAKQTIKIMDSKAKTTVPKAQPTTPKAKTTVPKAQPTTPKAKTTAPKAKPTTQKAKPTVPKVGMHVVANKEIKDIYGIKSTIPYTVKEQSTGKIVKIMGFGNQPGTDLLMIKWDCYEEELMHAATDFPAIIGGRLTV